MRKKEISLINVIFCFFVIAIHLLSEPLTTVDKHSLWHTILFFVQRPLFSAVSGFLFLSALKTSLPNADVSFKKSLLRLKRIWIPYLIAVMVYAIFEWITVPNSFDLLQFFLRIFTGRQAAHFYFIIIISPFYLLHGSLFYAVKRFPRLSLFCSLLVALITSLLWKCSYYNLFFTRYLLCYVLGILCGIYYQKFRAIIQKYTVWLCLLYALTAITDIIVSLLHSYGLIHTITQQIISILCIPIAIFFWYRAATFWVEKFPDSDCKIIDRRTFPIYLWHVLFILVAQWLSRKLSVSSLPLSFLLNLIITCLGVCIIIFFPSSQKLKSLKK